MKKIFDKLTKSIKSSFYDVINLRSSVDNKFLGNVYCRVIPRIGEIIMVGSSRYIIKNILYNVRWERIESVDVVIEEKHEDY